MFKNVLDYLFAPRQRRDALRQSFLEPDFAWGAGDVVVFALFVCALAFGVWHHRPWIDEAQAWLLARDASMHELLLRRLHYEGAPALWHLLLKLLIALHLPYAGLNWVAAALALPGIVLLLGWSPFPRIFRWLLPFTFYLQYQYAVLARPYVLYPALLFLLCITFTSPKPKPVWFALWAGLLANVNAHIAILSCVFTALYVVEHRKAGDFTRAPVRRSFGIASIVFLLLCACSLIVAFPAPDAMVVPAATGKVRSTHSLMGKLIPPENLPVNAPPLDPQIPSALEPSKPHAAQAREAPPATFTGAAATLAAEDSSAMQTRPRTLGQRVAHKLQVTALRSADLLTFPVAESNVLAVTFLVALCFWLWSRHSLSRLLPWLLTIPAAAFIWVYDHHTGIFALALVAAVWLALQRPDTRRSPRWLPAVFSTIALLVIVLQIGWSLHALRSETQQPYDAGMETEAFLSTHFLGKRIVGFSFETVSVQPYADHRLFQNWDHSYWLWSNSNPIDLRRTEALRQDPQVVVIGDQMQGGDTLDNQWAKTAPGGFRPALGIEWYWEQQGYRETHRFCGTRVMRAGSDNTTCELIFQPAATSAR